ncbi:glycosyltransferase family 2 protein [Hahella sp. SMD15-11]|uniref:Glycosyltransferase family 2 protein n=1 Tax=Thermohahella caldifontis TaxID=3142973 RepID=A0AB39V0B8_9GAMM
MNNGEVSIVIPAKNEMVSIGKVVTSLVQSGFGEVLVVDDGSSDETARVAEQAGARVVRHPYSKGNGAAIKTGVRAASGEVIVCMDADGQHNPDDIPRLLKKLDEGYDMVVGARSAESQASFGRRLANGFYNWLASGVSGQEVKDLTSGFRAVRAKPFKEFLYLLPNGFSYPTTITMAFFRAGYSVAYVPIVAQQRVGKSHIKPLRDGIRFLLIIFKVGTLYSPLKIFLPVSLLTFFIGLTYYGYTFFEFRRFTNMSALMFTTSLVIFMVGLVSEQITALMYKKDDR